MKHRASTQRILCRVCGDPTDYILSQNRSKNGTLCCKKESCKQASAALRHSNIKKANEKKFGTKYKATCRICSGVTDHHISRQGLVTCDELICKEASRKIKNAAIKAVALEMYAAGTRKRRTSSWDGVIRVSFEECLLKTRLEATGWQSQYKFLTGLEGSYVPRTFWLDFAKPEKKLCVEIDGSVHRLSHVITKDRRRDKILRDQGWQVLRITSKTVRDNHEAIVKKLADWDEGTPPCESVEPQQKICEREGCSKIVKNIDHHFCSDICRNRWWSERLRGKPSTRKGIKTGDPSKWNYIPCRICGEPTTTPGTPNHPRWGKKACPDNPVCQAASKLLTRQNQSKALKGNEKLIASTKVAWVKRKGSKTKETSSTP